MLTTDDILKKYGYKQDSKPKITPEPTPDAILEKYGYKVASKSVNDQPGTPERQQGTSIGPLKRNLLQNLVGLGPASKISNTLGNIGNNLASGWNSANAGLYQLSETGNALAEKYGPGFTKEFFGDTKKTAQYNKDYYRNLATQQQQNAEAQPNLPETVKVLGPSLQQVPTMGVAALAGPGAPAVFGAISGGQYMEEAEKEGATPEQQFAYGAIMGTVEGLTEKIPLGNTQKLFGSAGKKALLTYLKNIPDEFVQEAVTEIAGGVSKQAIYKPDEFITDGKVDFGKIAELGKRSLQAGGQGALTGAVIGGPGLVSAGVNTVRNNQNVQQNIQPNQPMTNNVPGQKTAPQISQQISGNQDSFLENRNRSPNAELSNQQGVISDRQGNTIQTETRGTDFGRTAPGDEQINSGRQNRPGNMEADQEIKPSQNEVVSVSPVAKRHLDKAGLTADDAYVAFEAKKKGKEWFTNEYKEIDNPGKTYDELVSKVDKLTKKEQDKIKFDLQFFAMREAEIGKKVQAKFISRFRTNSIERAVNISDETKAKMLVDDYGYEPEKAQEWLDNAKRNINNDKQQVIDGLMRTRAMLGGEQTAEAITLMEQMDAQQNKTEADYANINKFSMAVASRIRESARALKSVDTSMEKRFESTEGTLIEAQRTVKKAHEEIEKADPIKKERINKQSKEIKEGLKQARKEAVRLTAEELLANRVSQSVKESKGSQRDLVNDMVNELYKVAKESPLPQKKSIPTSPIEFLKLAIENRALYGSVWDKAQAIIREKHKDDPGALKLLDDYLKNPGSPEYSQNTLQRSIDVSMKDLELKLEELAKQFTSDRKSSIKKVEDFLIAETGAIGEGSKILAEQVYNKLTKNIEDKSHQILSRILKEPLKINKPVDTVKTIDELAALGAFKSQYYKVLTVSNKLPAKVRTLLKENDIDLGEIVKKSMVDIQFSRTKFLSNLMNRMNINNDDALLIFKESEKIFDDLVETKKKSTLENMFKERQPGAKKSLTDRVVELVNLGAWDDAAIVNILRENEKMPVLTNQDVKFIIDTMERSKAFPEDSRERQIEVGKVQKLIADKIPSSLRDKFRGLQRTAMLSNPKTLVTRNPGSNVIWGGVSGLEENTIGAVVDFVTSGIRKSERTTIFDPVGKTAAYGQGTQKGFREWVQDIGGGWENYKKLPKNATMEQRIEAYKKDRLNAVDTSPSRGQLELPKGRTFQNKTLNAIDDFVKNSLQLGDRPFYQGAYESRLYELKKIRKTDKADEAMETEARLYALDKVFQNDSVLSKKAGELRRSLGVVGDIAIPFTQTPANVLDKLLDHTPVGLGKVIFHSAKTAGKGTFNQKYFTDTLTRFLSGSGIMLFGYALASKGLLTGERDKNKRAAAFKQNVGISSYAFKFGDTYYTYDWMQPVGGMLAAGADAFYGGKGKDDFVQSLTSGMISAGDTIFNQSFVQGLLRLMGGYSPTTNVIKTVVETPTQFAPTAGKQAAQLFDPYVRNTKDDNLFVQTGKKIVSKVPIASKTLPIKLDTYGQPIKAFQGKNNLWNVAFNPGFQTKFEKSPANKLIMDVYEKTGSNDVFPKVAPKDFTVNKEVYPLSTEEQTKFQKIMGQKALFSLNQLASSSKGLNDEEKVKQIKRLIDKAYDEAKDQLIKEKGIKLKPKLTSWGGTSSWGKTKW
jgi:hypothetical protein